MSFTPANRIATLAPSATLSINARAKELRASGKEIINLTVGEPDLDTPDTIKKAGIAAIEAGDTKYTAVDGTAPLKEVICAKLKRDNHLNYGPNHIIVTVGAKQALYNAAQAILNDGDEAIIPAPYWVSYPAMVQLAGGVPVYVSADREHDFKITAEQLEQAITPRTKLFFLNSPSNPTGMVYTHDELTAIGQVLEQHPDVIILTDDIYEYLYWGGDSLPHILHACPSLTEQTIVINGVSKAYAMTGWRLGYAAGAEPIIKGMKKIQSHSTSNAASMVQAAAIEAIGMTKASLQDSLNTFREKQQMCYKAIQEMTGIACPEPQGAFYLFCDIREKIKNSGCDSDVAFCAMLLEDKLIATVPGTAFGAPGHMRLSCALDTQQLKLALEQLAGIFS